MASYEVETSDGSTYEVDYPDTPPTKSETSPVKDALKSSVQNVVGQGISQFVPGLESETTKRGIKAAEDMGQGITEKLGVPQTPNVQVGPFNLNPASATSSVIGGLLDPRSLAGGISGFKPAMKAGSTAMLRGQNARQLLARQTKVMNEAEKLTAQILQPTTNELAESIAKGSMPPSIQRGAESITKVKSFDQLVDSLRNTTSELFGERNAIFKEYNKPVANEMLDSLEEFATNATRSKVFSPRKLKVLDDIAEREAQYLKDNPNMDILSAQARKEELQKLTKPLLKKGVNRTGMESMELQAYDALRAGYRKAILKALPRDKAIVVDRINSKYEGLMDATEMAAEMQASTMKDIPQNWVDKIAASFGLSPKFTAFRLATKEFAGIIGKTRLERASGKLQDLRVKSELLKSLIASKKK